MYNLFFLHRRCYCTLRQVLHVYEWIGHILIFSLSVALYQCLTAVFFFFFNKKVIIFKKNMQMSIWKWNHFSTFKKTTLIQWIKQTDYVISILFKTESSLILCYKYPSVGIAVIKKLSKSYCTEKTKVKVKYSRLPCLVFFFSFFQDFI